MSSGPNPPYLDEGARLMSPEWMVENVPITVRGWEEEDEALADKSDRPQGWWLFSSERQERTVRLFWVSDVRMLAMPGRKALGLDLAPRLEINVWISAPCVL